MSQPTSFPGVNYGHSLVPAYTPPAEPRQVGKDGQGEGNAPVFGVEARSSGWNSPQPVSRWKAVALSLLILTVYVLHQDFWNWKRVHPLAFGFLPIGLAYHAAYSVLAALMMAVLGSLIWPKHLETVEGKKDNQKE